MKTAAIIAEYNPFHNGHLYLINETRKAGCTHIVAIMSGNAVQRGEIAIFDAHSRASAALSSGVDLVIELPVPFCCGAAKDFSKGATEIVKSLGVVDVLSFGSESGDTERLTACSEALENIDSAAVRFAMSSGKTYPSAIAEVLGGYDDILSGANNTLALEYLRCIKNSGITPFTVKRTAVHDSDVFSGNYASASKLREIIRNGGETYWLMPQSVDRSDISVMDKIEKALLFKLSSMTPEELESTPYTEDGIAERIRKYSVCSASISELYSLVKTRNVTHARVRRAVFAAALGIKKCDLAGVPYARVLAANKRGLEILSACKKSAAMPISTSLKELSKTSEQAKRTADLTELTSRLRWLARDRSDEYISEYSRKADIRSL